MNKDLYAVLGVSPTASQQEIDEAFRNKRQALGIETESRSAPPGPEMEMVAKAHELLGDPAKRKVYDKLRWHDEAVQPSTSSAPNRGMARNAADKERPSTTEKISRSEALFEKRSRLAQLWLFGIVVPFAVTLAVFSSAKPGWWIQAGLTAWYLSVGIAMLCYAKTGQRRLTKALSFACAIVLVGWNAISALALYVSRPGTFVYAVTAQTSKAVQQEGDPPCSSVGTLLIDALTPPSRDVEFLSTKEGRFLNAALTGNLSEVKALLDEGVDINTLDQRQQYSGNSALHHAARANNVDLAKLLLARGMDINASGPGGFSALHVAAGLGRLKMVEFLIDNGANLYQLSRSTNDYPLHIAFRQGCAKTVDLMIKKGVDVNAGPDGHPPLSALDLGASYYPSHTQAIESLVKAGANLLQPEKHGAPVFASLITKNDDAAFALIRSAKNFDWLAPVARGAGKVPTPPLVDALCARGKGEVIKHFLVNSPDKDRNMAAAVGPWGSPLHCVFGSRYSVEPMRALLDLGFAPGAANSFGVTPLHLVAQYGSEDKAALLLDRGANVNAIDDGGESAVFKTYSQAMFDLLVSRGADLSLRNHDGKTLFHLAARRQSIFLAQALQQNAQGVAFTDAKGQTPLHQAIGSNVVKMLV